VLENLGAKLRAELVNWPEHAVLQSILTIVDRILGFPLTSPLAQLVTGLELLVKTILLTFFPFLIFYVLF